MLCLISTLHQESHCSLVLASFTSESRLRPETAIAYLPITAQEFLQPRRLNIYTEILGSFFQSFRSLWDVIFSYLINIFQDLIWKLSNNLSRVIWEIARQSPGINPHWPKLVGVQVQDLRRQHPVWSKPWEMMVNQMYISSNILIINKVCKQCIPGTAAHCPLQHSWLSQNAHTWQTAFVYIGHCHQHLWFLKLLHCPLLCRKTFSYA